MNSHKTEMQLDRGVKIVTFVDGTMMEDNVQAAHAEIDALIEPGVTMLWDLEGVKYIASAFVGMFVSTMKKVRSAGGRFALCDLSPFVTEVFLPMPQHSPDMFFLNRDDALAALTRDA